jgi:hypothetical protein
LAGLALLCAGPALAFDPVQCPGAAAWAAAHPEESDEALARRDAARTFAKPVLRAELAERVARDQAARIAMLADRGDRGAQRTVAEVDADNLRWLHALVRTQDFPNVAQVGEQGMYDIWVLAQHADRAPGFQAALLPMLELRTAQGELAPSALARFTDRVLKAQGKPQRYGTQFPPEEWARPHFGLSSEESLRVVEANRRELGVMPLADYVCMMSEARKPRP